MPDLKALSVAMNHAVGKMVAEDERKSWEPKERVFYRITVQAAATASPSHRVFGFSRDIKGHDATCCLLPDGKPREINGRPYCLHSNSSITDEEALSLVRKGQGSVYKITERSQRLK